MRKEELLELGLSEEDATKVAEASAEEMKGYVTKARLGEVTDERDAVRTQVAERDGEIEKLKKVNPEELQSTISTLQQDLKDKDADHAEELKKTRIEAAKEAAVVGTHTKDPIAVRAHLDKALKGKELTIDDEGVVTGLDEAMKSITEGETSYLFPSKEAQLKGFTPTQGTDKNRTKQEPTTLEESLAQKIQTPKE